MSLSLLKCACGYIHAIGVVIVAHTLRHVHSEQAPRVDMLTLPSAPPVLTTVLIELLSLLTQISINEDKKIPQARHVSYKYTYVHLHRMLDLGIDTG